MKKLSIIVLLTILTVTTYSQDKLTQTIRGNVVDKESQMPLLGATIVLLNFDPIVGTITNKDGDFKLIDIPIGRHDIKISFIGYDPVILSSLNLSTGKELVLNIELEESVINLKNTVITAHSRKDKPININAISARSFTVEETSRYAGSYGDPARMAANYAGVMTGRDNRNDIIIRGNSSMGVLWRLDEIEIKNPNHFAALGTTGGPITIINNNLLSNSDFITGAFPAEYGNALAGIFDLKMRVGNNEKREYWVQSGWNGLEFGAEGPFSKKSRASYLVAYRYSLLGLINSMNIDLDIDPKYQDLNFKINLPNKRGRTTIYGLGGKSAINLFDSDKDQEDWQFENAGENIETSSALGMLAISNLYFINDKSRIKTNISVLGTVVSSKIDTFSINNPDPQTEAGENSSEIKYSISTTLKKKIDVKNTGEIGAALDIYNYDFRDSTYMYNKFIKDTDADGWMNLFRAFAQLHHKFSEKLFVFTGLHYQLLTMNNSFAVEPRLGLQWNLNEVHTLNLGFGIHSQMQPHMFYFIQSPMAENTYTQNNTDLEFSKSRHLVLGYDYSINEDLRLKVESYFQSLYNIPVKESLPAYSLINAGVEYYVDREDSLVNQGTGKNYGIELTLEKFFSRNYYFLINLALFNSQYKGYDKIERNTAFNSNYIFNAVGGYEFKIGKRKNGVLTLGLKFTWTGGRPYIPFDVEETIKQGTEVMDWDRAYEPRYDDYKRISLRFGLKRNREKLSFGFLMDLQYRTNYTNVYIERIDVVTGEIVNYQEMGFLPMVTWRIEF